MIRRPSVQAPADPSDVALFERGRTVAVGDVLRYARRSSPSQVVEDGLLNFHYLVQLPDAPALTLERGIFAPAVVRASDGPRRSIVMIRSSPWRAGTDRTPWRDAFDLDDGLVRYHGDNKSAGRSRNEAGGNKCLNEQLVLHTSHARADRLRAAPLMIFRGVEVDGRQKGNVEFIGVGVLRGARPVVQPSADASGEFENYEYELMLIDLGTDSTLDWRWIDARRDPNLTAAESLAIAPPSWRAWVEDGATVLDRVRQRRPYVHGALSSSGNIVNSPDLSGDPRRLPDQRTGAGPAADVGGDTFQTIGKRRIPPEPGVMKAIGLNHSLESAVADLIDNSIDARATRVLVRFVLHRGLVDRVLVVDNGEGMDEAEVDDAMRLGRPKKDSARALGHFGMGLKSASFSQALVLTVLTRKRGCAAQGRRMLREDDGAGFDVDVLAGDQVNDALDDQWPGFNTPSGTIVRWDAMRTFPVSRDLTVTNAFVEAKQGDLRHHLGLMFHRILEGGRLSIAMDVLDADRHESGFVFEVEPIDPFGYSRSGAIGYPKTLSAPYGQRSVSLHCHIWPGGSDSRYFRLAGAPAERYQGLYLYRNDRLLSAGQWGGVTRENKRRQLARVSIDIEDHLDAFTMSAEKFGVRIVADLVHGIEVARSCDGVTFQDYLTAAEDAFQQSNRRPRRRRQMLPPGTGLPPSVKRAIAREVDVLPSEEPLHIRWTRMPGDDFIQVDRDEETLWLNSKYRHAVLRGAKGSVNDAPLLKTLLFLLYEDIFHGVMLGSRDKENINLRLRILNAAAEIEEMSADV